MSNAENSDRRRRVIIMQSDDGDSEEPAVSQRTKSSEPKPRRLKDSELSQSVLSDFRQACGQTCPMLIRISSSESGARPKTVLWDRPSLMIGRAQECDLRLQHAEVSRQHAYLQIVNGHVYCADLGSGTGTHWPQASRHHGPVDFGEPISIGPYSLTIEPAPQYGTFEASSDSDEPDSVTTDGMFLDFREGNNEPRRWPATRDVTLIGSGACAKVKLVHSTVSKMHCAVVRAGQALWVVDLLSEDGTIVNGELCSTRRLESGDELRIGCFAVGVHYGSPLDDESIKFTSDDSRTPARLPASDQSQELARIQQKALAAAEKNGSAGNGMSEQFVLDVINQMGVMQQQALQHAQQSMNQALQAVSATYQGRIEALEKEYSSLKQQLNGHAGPMLPGPSDMDGRHLPEYGDVVDPLMPPPPHMLEPEFADLPEPEHGSYECEDPELKEQWVRQKMKMVEAELDKTRKGWGKKLIDMLGY